MFGGDVMLKKHSEIESQTVHSIILKNDAEDRRKDRMKGTMLEKDIERKAGEYAKDHEVLHLKFTSPGHAAVPDRILLRKIPDFLQSIIASHIRFVEYKRTGEKPTPAQLREHARLRALGFQVDVVDTVDGAKEVIDGMAT